MTLWPETLWPGHFGRNDILARVTFWPRTLWPETLWPGHFGQIDSLARVTFWPETLWPETVWLERQFGQCHFGW